MAAMRYFHISHGLRGCYMPDGSPYVAACKTRRALKDAIEAEADPYRQAGYLGASKRAVAQYAAELWADYAKGKARRYGGLPLALPLAPPHARKNYCEGVFVSHASRADFLEYVKESEQ